MIQQWDLYKRQPGFVLGFHGCDESVGEQVLAGKGHLHLSNNDYDWLGDGIYFWEGSPMRALQFAEDAAGKNKKTTKGSIKKPFVVGAIIDLGNCFNLTDAAALSELGTAYCAFEDAYKISGMELPKNKGGEDRLLRHLDRAVIMGMHELRTRAGLIGYDTVRSPFDEGGEIYPGSGFTAKAHIQIAVRKTACIRGYFRPIKSEVQAPR